MRSIYALVACVIGAGGCGSDKTEPVTAGDTSSPAVDAAAAEPDVAPTVDYPSAEQLPAELLADTERPAAFVVPEDYDPAKAWPLIVLLHGYNANASSDSHAGLLQDFYLQLSFRATTDGFIQLTPRGTVDETNAQFWNAADNCCDFYDSGVDDVAYLTQLLDKAQEVLHVDPSRVYLVGHSNGAYMAYRMICETPERFAGIMALAGAAQTCEAAAAVSVLHVHGELDEDVLFDGDSGVYPGAQDSVAHWAAIAGCAPEPEQAGTLDLDTGLAGEETVRTRYTGCKDDALIELWRIEDGGHLPSVNASFAEEFVAWLMARRRP